MLAARHDDNDDIVLIVKYDDGSVIVWSCFEGKKAIDVFQAETFMTKEQYHPILQRHAKTMIQNTLLIFVKIISC